MKKEIYYFTGTGNSLMIAKELGKEIEAGIIPVASSYGKGPVKTDADVIGFVFPVYFIAVPTVIEDFINRLEFRKDAFIFGIVNYGGVAGSTLYELQSILRKKGASLHYGAGMKMPDNSIVFKSTAENKKKFLEEFSSAVSTMAGSLNEMIPEKNISLDEVKNYRLYNLFRNLSLFAMDKVLGMNRKKTTDGCNSCGICEKACPVNNISLSDGRPVFGKDCAMCFACIHWCPQRAVRFGFMKLDDSSHYTHPQVRIKDIASQKSAS